MADPFQAKQRAQGQMATSRAKPMLTDTTDGSTAPAAQSATLSRPRNPRVGRAIKLLDVLTSGDEVLMAYLREHGAQAVQVVEDAKIDMAEAETPEEAELYRADPIDEILAQLATAMSRGPSGGEMTEPAVNGDTAAREETPGETRGVDLQALKASLMAECQEAIQTSALPSPKEPPPPVMFLDNCAIPGCRIHSISPQTGGIIHHYKESEMTTTALKRANQLLKQNDLAYVEVREDRLCAVTGSGVVTEYPL